MKPGNSPAAKYSPISRIPELMFKCQPYGYDRDGRSLCAIGTSAEAEQVQRDLTESLCGLGEALLAMGTMYSISSGELPDDVSTRDGIGEAMALIGGIIMTIGDSLPNLPYVAKRLKEAESRTAEEASHE